MADLTTDYHSLRHEVGAVRLARDVVRVVGPDAVSYLQGQLSQDVEVLAGGASAWSFVLEPQGKVDAWFRVTRLDDGVLIDVDGGAGDAVVTRLERFLLRTKATVERLDWSCVAVRGPNTPAALPPPEGGVAIRVDWPPMTGTDLLGPAVAIPDGVPECGVDAYEALRIEAGIPAMGRELTPATIPEESGVVDRSVSFTKGCYTGQELVARVDSRGRNVPRRLRGVIIGANVIPPVGAAVVVGGDEVGALTSVAQSLDLRAPVALAYIRRGVESPADAVVRWDGGEVAAQLAPLPLVT
ncbi:MAG TPA: glycine cleavage T C-terminal barrel domain-containing protein [Acidimicrobiales bacterium]|nr:glycine cleavage T C-terminal barrel domain-containing protein [Acidimicrobiales bacterium]